jgi:2-polyprenyl-6-methoxyphenol hydroxylase-like FAD-dependent oxidoreductase
MREHKVEVLIVGAGPVGLMTANLLANAGIKVEIIDREERATTRSYACALHPRSLELLATLGLAAPLIERGRRIKRVAFYEGPTRRAEIDFAELKGQFPFVLALPQSVLEMALEERLRQNALEVNWNHRLDQIQSDKESVIATIEKLGGTAVGYIVPHWETVVLKASATRAQFLVGTDGHNSLVRQRLGIEYERMAGPEAFAAIEFTTEDRLEDELRVVLDETTTNVLWPLPGNRCRWTFQLRHTDASGEFPGKARRSGRAPGAGLDEDLRRWVQSIARRRAPWFSATVNEIVWFTQVAFEHRWAKQFGRGNCWLAGDAAHQTGPVGAQSMNVGLFEATALASRLRAILREEASLDLLHNYGEEARAEWRRLFGLDRSLQGNDWVKANSSRILPCMPASGEQLEELTNQLIKGEVLGHLG